MTDQVAPVVKAEVLADVVRTAIDAARSSAVRTGFIPTADLTAVHAALQRLAELEGLDDPEEREPDVAATLERRVRFGTGSHDDLVIEADLGLLASDDTEYIAVRVRGDVITWCTPHALEGLRIALGEFIDAQPEHLRPWRVPAGVDPWAPGDAGQ